MLLLLVAAIAPLAIAPSQTDDRPRADCAAWTDCRDRALQAADRGDYETFHDLAWRTVQKAPADDPQPMQMLARAQSLSGRPHDALVTIRRLAERGIATDAAHHDFRRVRALPDWPSVVTLLPNAPTPDPPPPAAVAPAVAAHAPDAAPAAPRPFVPAGGIAHDTASARFILGDARRRKLVVVDESAGRAQDLVRAASAGFEDVAAVEIDHRRGDLWVVSASGSAPNGSTTALHKVQLISGRPLDTFHLPPDVTGARFTDVAITPAGAAIVLDGEGGRVFRLPPRSRDFQLIAHLHAFAATSLAPIAEGAIYVAHAGGLLRVDANAKRVVAVAAPKGVDVRNVRWMRPHRGALVAAQPAGESCRFVRLRLDGIGRRVAAVEALAETAAVGGCPPATVSGDQVYYLREGSPGAAAPGNIVIGRIPLP